MRPTQIKTLIKSLFQAKLFARPIHIEGSPGLGKTEIVGQVAKELGVGFIAIHAPILQPEDYGFPVISADRTNVDFIVSQDKFPLQNSLAHPDTGILLIDELPQAPTHQQTILANLCQEREIHGKRIKPGWMIVTTGNRVSDRAGANRLLSHLRNKLDTIAFDVSKDDWTQWAISAGVAVEVVSYMQFRPDALNAFDPHQELNPTPRSWTRGVADKLGVIPPELEFETFKGSVGEAHAAEFMGYLKIYRELPHPDTIRMNPETTPVPGPDKAAVLYAISGALAHTTTKDNFGPTMLYVKRMPPEFGMLYLKDVMRRNPDIQNTRDFIQWATNPENQKLLG